MSEFTFIECSFLWQSLPHNGTEGSLLTSSVAKQYGTTKYGMYMHYLLHRITWQPHDDIMHDIMLSPTSPPPHVIPVTMSEHGGAVLYA